LKGAKPGGIYFTAQLRNDASIAIAGELCADLADHFEDDRILDPLTSRFLVVGRAREIHELASSREGKTGRPLTINIGSFVVDGRFF
jgi:hypothetical protein